MPRDEPVGSFGRLALKPTEFREQVGLIRIRLLHDVPPCFDDSGSDQLPRKAGVEQGRGRRSQRDTARSLRISPCCRWLG